MFCFFVVVFHDNYALRSVEKWDTYLSHDVSFESDITPYLWPHCCMTIYTSHIDHFTPQHTAFEQSWFDTVCNIVTRWVTYRENHFCMIWNYNYLTTIFRSILTQIYVFLVLFTFLFHFDLEKVISQNCKYMFFYQKLVYLGDNTSKFCKRIIVVHVHAAVFFSKVHPACHNTANK